MLFLSFQEYLTFYHLDIHDIASDENALKQYLYAYIKYCKKYHIMNNVEDLKKEIK
ncbi:MAG: hypothetical protein RR537_03090 [Longicatena sp.]